LLKWGWALACATGRAGGSCKNPLKRSQGEDQGRATPDLKKKGPQPSVAGDLGVGEEENYLPLKEGSQKGRQKGVGSEEEK